MYNGHRHQAIHLHAHSHFTDEADFEVDFVPELGFCLLGNFGMEFEQNLNHKSGTIDAVNLEYENFEKPFYPLINSKLVYEYLNI